LTLTITPRPQALGAIVTGLDLSGGLTDETVAELHAAWLEHLVLFFPRIDLDLDQHIELGSKFGRLAATTTGDDDYRGQQTTGPNGEVLVLDASKPQGRANAWHTDVTFAEIPPKGSLLAMQICPAKGGDTLWSNQYAAYEALSPALKDMIDGLDAMHGRPGLTGLNPHPMVTVHPETGRKALFVNRGWTTSIVGMGQNESAGVLAALFNHAEKPEFNTRWTWTPGDAALWDNRCTMHYAVNDYEEAPRILHRVTIYDR
jgi:taurine dioxygenase